MGWVVPACRTRNSVSAYDSDLSEPDSKDVAEIGLNVTLQLRRQSASLRQAGVKQYNSVATGRGSFGTPPPNVLDASLGQASTPGSGTGKTANRDIRKWRGATSMDKVTAFARPMRIDIFKLDACGRTRGARLLLRPGEGATGTSVLVRCCRTAGNFADEHGWSAPRRENQPACNSRVRYARRRCQPRHRTFISATSLHR